MNSELEKANFYLEADEFDKAESIFSKLIDEDGNSIEALRGMVICKISMSDFEKSHLKIAGLYLERLMGLGVSQEDADELSEGILGSISQFINRINEKFRQQANEIVKRPALDNQLYVVKVLSDTTAFLGFLSDNASKYQSAINLAEKVYDFGSDKEEVAFQIVKLIDQALSSIRNTHSMDGKLLANSNGLSELNQSRARWVSLAGLKGASTGVNPSQAGGCMVLISYMLGSMGFLIVLFVLIVG
jgi:tetratricopeptide (TPR) repeat protein